MREDQKVFATINISLKNTVHIAKLNIVHWLLLDNHQAYAFCVVLSADCTAVVTFVSKYCPLGNYLRGPNRWKSLGVKIGAVTIFVRKSNGCNDFLICCVLWIGENSSYL